MSSLFTSTIRPPVLLAPLAGITDAPFRDLVLSFGADWVVSEMIASQEMMQAKPGMREKAELGLHQGQTAVQLAGRDAYWMAEAARFVESQGARVIDLNMGCPAKRVVSGACGSALLKDLDHAMRLIEAVVKVVNIPVTLKTRLGWDTEHNAATLAQRAQHAGIQMITIHGRTRCQFFKGHADWHAIANVVQAVSIPVIANGDIKTPDDARTAINAAQSTGLMIGRAVRGRPWLLANIRDAFGPRPIDHTPTPQQFYQIVVQHYESILTFYGQDLGLRLARKHLGWYMDVAQTHAPMRRAILTANDPHFVIQALQPALTQAPLQHL